MISNESCDNIRTALPVVPCPNSVCVKFVVQGAASNRAVCSSSLNPIIVRDCWSRVLTSNDSSLQLKPFSTKPVSLFLIKSIHLKRGKLLSNYNKL